MSRKTKMNQNQLSLSHQKAFALAAAVVALIALLAVPTAAWFRMQRSIQTITLINTPNNLRIGSGDRHPMTELDLSDIDVSVPQKYQDVVFCVYTTDEQMRNYKLQLAYTTNIGFRYTIFPAQKNESGVNQIVYLGNQYAYDAANALAGSYLNPSAADDRLAQEAGVYHERTYAGLADSNVYNMVQKNAEPLYWQSVTLERNVESATTDYYVLRISWDESVQNNKETDLVYIMAAAEGT